MSEKKFDADYFRYDDDADIRKGIVHRMGVPVVVIKHVRAIMEKISYQVQYTDRPAEGEQSYFSTWYLRPEYHVIEIIGMLVVTQCIAMVLGHIPNIPLFARDPTFFERVLGYIILCDYLFHIWCKVKSENVLGLRNMMYLFVPCSISHFLMVFFVCFFPSWNTPRVMQYLLTCSIYPINAFIFPDNAHCKIPFEYEHFWVQHALLIFTPYYFLLSRLDVAEEYLTIWVIFGDWGLYAIETFLVMWPLSVLSGVNINYLMSPPPAPPVIHKFGIYYRIPVVSSCAGLMVISGLLLPKIVVFLCQWWPLRVSLIAACSAYSLRKVLGRVL